MTSEHSPSLGSDAPDLSEPEPGDIESTHDAAVRPAAFAPSFATQDGQIVRPINWNALTAEEARYAWADLDAWVSWLRTSYGLPAAVIPPFWHRHDELIWELSALHTHWRNSYDPDNSPSAPIAWHREFTEARARLREWVAACGTRTDNDRPTRQTPWPGEQPPSQPAEVNLADRNADFAAFVDDDLAIRMRIQRQAVRDVEQRQADTQQAPWSELSTGTDPVSYPQGPTPDVPYP